MEHGFIAFFQAILADVYGAVIVGGIIRLVNAVGIPLADTADVTDHMRSRFV